MQLRDTADIVKATLELDLGSWFGDTAVHALVQNVRDVQSVFRPVQTTSKKQSLEPWVCFSFEPYRGIVEPFNVNPGSLYAMLRVHKQPTGVRELIVHVDRDIPTADEPIIPQFYISFSRSEKVSTILRKEGDDPFTMRIFHTMELLNVDRSKLPLELCLPGFQDTFPEGYVEDGIPGIVDLEGAQRLYVGSLQFFNQGRTLDRVSLVNCLLNAVALATAARYIRNLVT